MEASILLGYRRLAMSVRYNYTDAAMRLVSDAVVLWSQGTRETAAHLAGLSAECSLKSILVGLGLVVVTNDGQIAPPKVVRTNRLVRVHINPLWGEFQSRLAGHSGAVYVGLLPASVPAPFDGWSVDHRYVGTAELADEDMERWLWAAIVLRDVLQNAVSRGEAQ